MNYILIRSNGPMLKLPDLDKPVTIIWMNNGNCGIISADKVENLMQIANDHADNNDRVTPKLAFFWDDVEEVREI
ncbi:hypothetical protein LCGC14_0416080 [marine sediment metagenome]|uniref:Uncharacterized protein n=1 Tax=marine sediment metagenome TaxID=412755 RepID=A0A0F9TAG1_9ZZZZ